MCLNGCLRHQLFEKRQADQSLAQQVTLAHTGSADLPPTMHSNLEKVLKPISVLALPLLLATPASSEEWTCAVAYDELNGGGTFTISDEVMTFVSNWPHRRPEILKCKRVGQTSECLGGKLTPTKSEGASAFLKLYSVDWEPEGGPGTITIRQPSVIFAKRNEAFELTEAFPAIGYKLPATNCKAN